MPRQSVRCPLFNLGDFYMKKTLVALAALAATGAFAQVTLSGNVTMGYEANVVGAVGSSADAAGLGTDTTAIKFVANEDMGGGYKAAISMEMDNINRSGDVGGRNASLNLTTPVGMLTLATSKASDYLSGGLASVGSYYSGWDEKIFGARSSRDIIAFTAPVGPIALGVTYQETANVLGLGAGTAGGSATTGQSLTGLTATYGSGALNANLTFLQFASNKGAGAARDQIRLSGNYDLGMAKLGAGVVTTNHDGGAAANPRVTDIEIAANVPMGNAYIGASWVSRKVDEAASIGNTSGTNTGYSLEVGYNLSKRTALIANFARWTQGAQVAGAGAAVFGVVANQEASSKTQVLLSHSF